MLALIGFSQNSDYYYYKSKKVNLYKSNSRHYILTNKNKSGSAVVEKLSQDNFILEKMHPNKVRNSFFNREKNTNDGNWAIVKGNISLKDYDWITYKAPFYYTKDSVEVGLSHLFYVKLKKKQDLTVLKEFAERKKVEIIGQNDFMPLWFTLACS
ncbi:hypothetical protein [Gelatiniphilus marinus]|uniref:Uncharacterized protein n=1 Tax=Gelatiniphilus marinus TaxID=1759464 RepID=A0ABW5JWW2_9FLAO